MKYYHFFCYTSLRCFSALSLECYFNKRSAFASTLPRSLGQDGVGHLCKLEVSRGMFIGIRFRGPGRTDYLRGEPGLHDR